VLILIANQVLQKKQKDISMILNKYRNERLITLFADGVTVGVHPPNLRLLLFGVAIVVLTCNKD
jgi:hypothetical protein